MLQINLWIVEDNTTFRRTLRSTFIGNKEIHCSHVFPSCIEMFDVLETEDAPDLVLMDLGLPVMSGLEGIKKLKSAHPKISILVLTAFDEKEKIVKALELGADGYLLKTSSKDEIIDGVEQVFYGSAILSPNVAKIVIQEMRTAKPTECFDLTERELDVLGHLANGSSIKVIADKLGITRRTVAFHLENIYMKLKVQSQSGAVAKAIRSGIV